MNSLFWLLKAYTPVSVKNHKLRELAYITGNAFGTAAPDLNSHLFETNLKVYAMFTKSAGERAIANGQNIENIKQSLFRGARQMGQELQTKLRPKSRDEIISLICLIYKILQIDFAVVDGGEITVNRCFFSNYYSKETCTLISALDKGMVAGISNGWQLEFTQQLTEGFACCKGNLKISTDIK
jgi:hypothetical protein